MTLFPLAKVFHSHQMHDTIWIHSTSTTRTLTVLPCFGEMFQ